MTVNVTNKLSVAIVLWLGLAQSLLAADPDIYSHKRDGAIGGADVVAYYSLKQGDDAVMGDKAFSYDYMGASWRFSSAENRDLFAANPEKYLPQYGGYCAFAVSKGFTKPVDPDYWHIVDGKLYLNYNFFADRKWRNDRAAAIAQGDVNWPNVLKACEAHDNCG